MSLLTRLKSLRHQREPREEWTCSTEDNFVLDENFDPDKHPPCPRCGSNDVAVIVYGKPLLTRRIMEGFDSGKLISGGCMVRDKAPRWHCHNCRKDFGKLKDL